MIDKKALEIALRISAPIDSLGLSTKSYNALKRWGIITVRDLCVKRENGGLKRVRGIGEKATLEIEHALEIFIGDDYL